MKTLLALTLASIIALQAFTPSATAQTDAEIESRRPIISVTDAIRIAKEYVHQEKLEVYVSKTFIAKVRYVDRKADNKMSREPYWEVSYEPVERSTMGGEIWVTVGMDGKCSHQFGK